VNVIVLHSGGIDSTTLLYTLRAQGHAVRGISFDYGQRHRRELIAAGQICTNLGIEHRVADLATLRPLLAGSALTDDIPIPTGHYTAESMKVTVVPNRNMIMLSVAIGWAVSVSAEAVAYAAHAGDHAIYPDCRPEFAEAMDAAAALCDWRPIRLLRPFVALSKTDILRRGHELGVPFELTWSCYQGGDQHCGRCGTCTERREAFRLAGIPDPTLYSA
jgi:7-cyano-7-deazaguanine synthase